MSAGKPSLDSSVLTALPDELTWTSRPQKSDLASLPACPAVYLLLAESKVPVQLASTQHLRRLANARLADPNRPRHSRADLAEIVRGIRWRGVHSAFEGRWWYYRLARQVYPKQYLRLISFGASWFLHVDWQQRVPEIRVTERIWQAGGTYVGPWLTHDTCQKALEGVWDLFDLCRYPEQVRRAPHGQRCAYAEMRRCAAPCDGTVPLERYLARCRAAWAFVRGAVRAWIDDAKRRMKQAAAEQRFEQAAQIKRQLAFAWRWHDHWLSLVRPADELNYLLAVPVTRRRSWKLFLFWQGHLSEGPILTGRQLPKAATAWLRQRLAGDPQPVDSPVRMEQMWLVAHFRQSREGDASLIRPLVAREVPAGLEEDLRQWVQQRPTRKPTAETAAPCVSGSVCQHIGPLARGPQKPQ